MFLENNDSPEAFAIPYIHVSFLDLKNEFYYKIFPIQKVCFKWSQQFFNSLCSLIVLGVIDD